jgi:zinc transport system ATP-binding protein
MNSHRLLVATEQLTVSYGSVTALENVSLQIYDDDFLGIIGPNGGGKSSLVRAIMGNIPYQGFIHYADELTDGKGKRIGYLPQLNLFDKAFPISVKEVVLSGLQSLHGFSHSYSKSDMERVMQLLRLTGIAKLADRAIGEISGGQMQRALLCRAIIAEPKLLILDEPANFVDNHFENELYHLLKELNHRMAIVMVSHDLGTISSVVKNIVCVNRHVHRHNSNLINEEQLRNYGCPIQLLSHGDIPHTVLRRHDSE